MSTQIRVSGLQATSGQRYVSIETDSHGIWRQSLSNPED